MTWCCISHSSRSLLELGRVAEERLFVNEMLIILLVLVPSVSESEV